MKSRGIVLASILLLPFLCSAQDLSNFYQISGFRLPALRAGQYMLSLTPRYSSAPGDFTSTSTVSSGTSATYSNSADHDSRTMFSVALSALYGFTEKTTLSVSVEGAPDQPAGDRTYSYGSYSFPVSSGAMGTDNFRTDQFLSSLVLVHRIQPNVEFSISASYYTSDNPVAGSLRQINSGTIPSNPNGTSASSSKTRNFDIQASIVILGN